MPRKRYTYAEFCADLAAFGVAPADAASLTSANLKGRYNSRVKQVHPDKPGGSTEKAAALNAANDRLKDWIKRNRPAWAEQGSVPPQPDPAAEAARAERAKAAEEKRKQEAEEKRRREAEEQAERRRKTEEVMQAAREAAAEQEQRRKAQAELEQAAAAVRAEAEAQREREEAAGRREAERQARKRRLLLWPLTAAASVAGSAVRHLPIGRLAAVGALLGALYGFPSLNWHQLGASLPPMPKMGLPFAVAPDSSVYREGPPQVYTNNVPDRLHSAPRDRRCSLIDNRCWYK